MTDAAPPTLDFRGDPARVKWTEQVGDSCAYCGAPIPEEAVPRHLSSPRHVKTPFMKLRDGIPEPLGDLCIALHGLGGESAETRAAAVIRMLAEALVRYEQGYTTGHACARLALSMACDLATSSKAPPQPSAKPG